MLSRVIAYGVAAIFMAAIVALYFGAATIVTGCSVILALAVLFWYEGILIRR